MSKINKEEKISIWFRSVPPGEAAAVSESLIMGGIKGNLNYTSTSLNVSPNVYLEEYDMITSLEKVSYFVKQIQE